MLADPRFLRNNVIATRYTDREKHALELAAEMAGMSLATYTRTLALEGLAYRLGTLDAQQGGKGSAA